MSTYFGNTWWGEQFLNALENIDYSNRLVRGSRYARNGSVKSIQIVENIISAKVKGRQPSPYQVQIIIPPFFNPELKLFLDELAQKPALIAKLLNKELDQGILKLALQANLRVFPKQWSDYKMRCSCPDWAVPCKHLAAVIYMVSTEIDNDPFLIFKLHKLDLVEKMKKYGVIIASSQSEVPALIDLYYPENNSAQKYNDPENAYQKINFASIPPLNNPLSALLSSNPPFYAGSADFKATYQTVMNRLVRQADKIIKKDLILNRLWPVRKETPAIDHFTDLTVTIDKFGRTSAYINENKVPVHELLCAVTTLENYRLDDYQPYVAALSSAYQLALHLMDKGAIIPQLIKLDNDHFKIRWLPVILNAKVRELIEELDEILPADLFLWTDGKNYFEIHHQRSLNLISVLLAELIPPLAEPLDLDKFTELFFKNKPLAFNGPGENALSGGIAAWLNIYFLSLGQWIPQLIVDETRGQSFDLMVNLIERKADKSIYPLNKILSDKKHVNIRYEVLQNLALLSTYIKGLDKYINAGGLRPMRMDNKTFSTFLSEVIPAIELLNIEVLLPIALKNILKPKPTLYIKTKAQKGVGFLRLEQLLDFDWQIAIGDQLLSYAEFLHLTKKSDGLLKYKAQYIYVDKNDLEKIDQHFKSGTKLNSFQLLQAAISEEYRGAKIEMTPQIRKMITDLTNYQQIPLPKGILALLRPYQTRGYSWMYRNAKIGFGTVLADDMGLGKTLQVVTTIMKYKEEGWLSKGKALVVAPTGLISNWENEIQKFAPKLNYFVYHGSGRKLPKQDDYDTVITSYGTVRGDLNEFIKRTWFVVIIDEAQNIKNLNAEQTKAVKSIPADNYIAMSGTPVENRLSELWSIMDFSNRGLLGSNKEFAEQFSTPIERYNDITLAEKLKKVISPFMLRRLKSDKSIIADLPERIEMNNFAMLTPAQAMLYNQTLQKALDDIEKIKTTDHKSLFVRRGLVLQMILALKQICNHPAQYLKNKRYDEGLSGKILLLFDTLDSIMESGEKVLIFSQFTEMGTILKHLISKRYGDEPLFLHGQCSVKQRNEMVENFQHNHAYKIFILSLKAGGTGLNLTAATQVIHYDLWWNPAVEAQATDRAYRIGQRKNVFVHRFITKHTFEEKINEMMQNKKALANLTISAGENWIGNLSNKELKEIFSLGN